MDGVINFFKPRGMTSHDAVYFFRRLLKTKKVGHTGTLDPNATGVLPICIGKGTKISEYLLEVDKEYIGEVTLGISTDTQDGDGNVIHTSNKVVSEGDINETFNKFKGDLLQTPPMYSALKHKGKKLYELAREGITIEREPRKINIKDIKILNNYNNKEIIFYTKCTRGTYIRTICEDIGTDLGTYGYMSYLIRVGVGSFNIKDSYSMDYLSSLEREELLNLITPMDKALDHMDEIVIADDLYKKLVNGVVLPVESSYVDKFDSILKVYCQNKFIGTGRIKGKENNLYLKMDKVLIGD